VKRALGCSGGVAAIVSLSLGCVPEGPPTRGDEPQPTVRTIPEAVADASGEAGPADPPVTDRFVDAFDRGMLGADWRALSDAWQIRDGQLCGKDAKNRGIWLRRRLPPNARIELDARSDTEDGDLKVEVWGDGKSGATSSTYSDATSYLFILGGWRNTLHVLARLDEHGDEREVVEVDPDAVDPRQQPVHAGQTYRFRIERRDGRIVSWWVDDVLVHELDDAEPLLGDGHDHFGFNDWTAAVCFDNLEITPL
jgi:hypothetical protein